jgi:glycosyltransferase involved in cell wall biosynthesis
MHGIDGVTVHGYLPEVKDIVSASRVLVVPLFIGGGVRVKLLEAMAEGRPFVATPVGALGLNLNDGAGRHVTEDPEQFASATITLLVEDGEWLRAGAAGIRFVKKHHTPVNAQEVVLGAINQARAHHDGR